MLGIGTGLFVAPNLRTMLGAVPLNRRGIGLVLFSLFLDVGLTVSLNIAILIMSLTMPYNLIMQIVARGKPATISVTDRLQFVASLKAAHLALGIINAIAVAPSLLQVSRKPKPRTEKLRPSLGEKVNRVNVSS